MRADREHSRVRRSLPFIAGIAFIIATFLLNPITASRSGLDFLEITLAAIGCFFIVAGIVVRDSQIQAALAKVSVSLLAVLCCLGLCEIFFRAIHFNFAPLSDEIPIFNRPAALHIGGGILRRPGPATWRGKPLSSLIHWAWGNENAYPDEQVIEIRYDKLGFRNPPYLADWEVVVTGDSFVESGYLPYEQIFTTVAANRLGVRIKNLGVTGAGAVFETAYVKHYGKAPSTKHAVLCFFDGNDVSDLIHEVGETNFIARTGHRLGAKSQDSLIIAIHDRLKRLHESPRYRTNLVPNAILALGTRQLPVAVQPVPPPRWEDLNKSTQELIAAAMMNWAETVRSQGMQPWVMCIPDIRRVFDGYFRYTDTNSPMTRWQSREFGPPLSKICATNGIRFIDAFPVLREEAQAGRLPYNMFGDLHLSAHGSRVVGELLAESLRDELKQNHGRVGASSKVDPSKSSL